MSETDTNSSATKDKLIDDMKRVVADAEELLRATADQAGERLDALRNRLQANLTVASSRLAEFAATDIGDTTQDIRAVLQKITAAADHAAGSTSRPCAPPLDPPPPHAPRLAAMRMAASASTTWSNGRLRNPSPIARSLEST